MKTAKLKDICDVITRGISPKYTVNETEGIVVLNQKCIREGKISYEPARWHDQTKKFNETKLVKPGDILINSTGHGTLGRTALVKDVASKTTVDSHVTIVRPKEGMFIPEYFAYLVRMCEKDFIAMATGTSGQTELPRALLYEYEVTYQDSLQLQKQVAAKLDTTLAKIDRAIELTEQRHSTLHALKKSLLNQELLEVK